MVATGQMFVIDNTMLMERDELGLSREGSMRLYTANGGSTTQDMYRAYTCPLLDG